MAGRGYAGRARSQGHGDFPPATHVRWTLGHKKSWDGGIPSTFLMPESSLHLKWTSSSLRNNLSHFQKSNVDNLHASRSYTDDVRGSPKVLWLASLFLPKFFSPSKLLDHCWLLWVNVLHGGSLRPPAAPQSPPLCTQKQSFHWACIQGEGPTY